MAAKAAVPRTGFTVRPPAVAGSFYPGTRAALTAQIGDLLAEAGEPGAPTLPAPKALIVPHAGYIYSGPVAALGYALLRAHQDTYRRVVLLGPTHRVAVRGMALPGADAFATPLGEVLVDADLAARASAVMRVATRPDVHAQEHSLEVQLPFLQTVLPGVPVLPVAVGDATPAEVATLLDELWGGPETLVIVSSDLSHYHPYDEAAALDDATISQILSLQVPVYPQQACGAYPMNGLLLMAVEQGLVPRLLGACNSGDTAGDRDAVVGYACIAFTTNGPAGGEAVGGEDDPA
jgi:AmmeMemoRadiSam system protein B